MRNQKRVHVTGIALAIALSIAMTGMTVCAADTTAAAPAASNSASMAGSSASTDTSSKKRIPSSEQGNTVPTQMTDSYQNYLNEKTALTQKGWTITVEHLNAATDVYWMEGKTAEGAYFKYFSYDTATGEPQILASSVNAANYAGLSRYWLTGSEYDAMLAKNQIAVGYASKTAVTDGKVQTVYIGFVYAWPA